MTIGPATCARRQRSLQPTASSPPVESRAAAYFVPDFSTAACAELGGRAGLIQHKWTRALEASIVFWSF
jgi:hypothetical protein